MALQDFCLSRARGCCVQRAGGLGKHVCSPQSNGNCRLLGMALPRSAGWESHFRAAVILSSDLVFLHLIFSQQHSS